MTIPLTRLPAVLGRSHSTGDINFFSLGPAKALSRQHCVIDYRDNVGGKLTTPKSAMRDSEEEGKLEYEKAKPFSVVNQQQGTGTTTGVKQEDGKTVGFPPRGAFVLEALGKNLIMVGNHRLKQGEIAILNSGTPIRMNAYSLYFLLPMDTPSPRKTLEIPLETNNDSKSSPSPKKGVIGGFKRKMPGSSSPQDMPKPKVKKPKAAPFAQLQAELDALPIGTLLERMNEAVESERWERKHQLIGSTISLHAVKDATSASEIREQAADGGVARTEIMRWIKESPKYTEWVEQMNSKMEAKSYQNTITKALLKAGNVRTGSGGRYIKWILPGVKLKTDGEGNAADKSPSSEKEKDSTNDNEEKANHEEEEEEEEEEPEEHDEEGEGGGDDNEEDEGGENEEENDGNDNEEAEGDQNEEAEKAPTNFAKQREEESEDDQSMEAEGASLGGGEAESGNEGGTVESGKQANDHLAEQDGEQDVEQERSMEETGETATA